MVAVDKWFPFLDRSHSAGTPAAAARPRTCRSRAVDPAACATVPGLARVFSLVVASRRRSRGTVQHKSQLWAGRTPQPTVASRDVVARRHALMSRRLLLPGF